MWVCVCVLGCLVFVVSYSCQKGKCPSPPGSPAVRYLPHTPSARSRTLVVIACFAASSRTEPGPACACTTQHNTTQHKTSTRQHKSPPFLLRCSHWSALCRFFLYIEPSSPSLPPPCFQICPPPPISVLSPPCLAPIGHSVRADQISPPAIDLSSL